MRLKPGLKRQSCDFCFRRKMKCDRASRKSTAQPQCSHCALRKISCTTDLGSVRSSRQRDSSAQLHARPSLCSSDSAVRTAHTGHSNAVKPQTASVTSAPSLNLASNVAPSAGPDGSINSQDPAVEWPWPEDDWNMGAESISFLDTIFSQDFDLDTMGYIPAQGISEDNAGGLLNPYEIPGLDANVMEAAINAYFDLASLSLPVLLQSAFRVDYKSRIASTALVYAVACRGCPFLTAPDKWSIQQQLANHFQRVVLEDRAAADNGQSIRLDDLEALAIMVDFTYDQAEDLAIRLQSQLGKLFLTHDSLVLMTLQYQILCHTSPSAGSTSPLDRSEERKNLLFWHVYGKDAFYTLDRRIPSRIGDDHVENREQLALHQETYLDAILTLAIIARKIRYTFQTNTNSNADALHHKVIDLYEALAQWRRVQPCSLPTFAREEHHPLAGQTVRGLSQSHTLQAAVVLFLEHNCYMQIEAWASDLGMATPTSLDTTMLYHLIEYNTLKTAKAIAEVAPSLQSQKIYHHTSVGTTTYSLVDVAPGILRDICAGTSNWLCNYGMKLLDRGDSGHCSVIHETQEPSKLTRQPGGRLVEKIITVAIALRETVAAAASHRDTSQLVNKLDGQLSLLKRMTN